MEIIVEIHRGEDGRPTGSVRSVTEAESRPFSGNLEFLALVEDLYLAEPKPAPSSPDSRARSCDNTERRAQ